MLRRGVIDAVQAAEHGERHPRQAFVATEGRRSDRPRFSGGHSGTDAVAHVRLAGKGGGLDALEVDAPVQAGE